MKRTLPAYGLRNMIRFYAILLTLGFMFIGKGAMAAPTLYFSHGGLVADRSPDTVKINVCRSTGTFNITDSLAVIDSTAGETINWSYLGASSGSLSPIPASLTSTAGGRLTPTSTITYTVGASATAYLRISVSNGTGLSDTLVFKVTVIANPNTSAITNEYNSVRVGSSIQIDTPYYSGGTGAWGAATSTAYSISASGSVTGLSTLTSINGVWNDSVAYNVSPPAGCPATVVYFPISITTNTPPAFATSGLLSVDTGTPGSSSIIINGSGFSPVASENLVYFGGVRGTVTSSTTGSLTVTVPLGAAYSTITVVNALTGMARNIESSFVPRHDTSGIIPSTNMNIKSPDNITLPGGLGGEVQPFQIAYGDLDGDGYNDMAIGSNNGNGFYKGKIYIYRNIGRNIGVANSSNFRLVDSVTAGSGITSLVIADIDNDGKPEIISACSKAALVGINKNRSVSGTILMDSVAARIVVPATAAELAVADFNADGRQDIVVACAGLFVGSNNIPSRVVLIQNNFVPPVSSTPINIWNSLCVAGMDTSTLRLYRASDLDKVTSVAIADFNNDGKPDIVASKHSSRGLDVFTNTTTGTNITFGAPSTISTASGVTGFPNQVRVGDFDQDGEIDIVAACSDYNLDNNDTYRKVTFFRNRTSGATISFPATGSDRLDVSAGVAPTGVAVGDLDGDSKPDVVCTNSGDATVSIIRNTSSGGIGFSVVRTDTTNRSSFATTTGTVAANLAAPIGVTIGDIENNTVADIIVVNQVANTIALFRNAPVPDTTPIAGTDSICLSSATLYRSFHRPGTVGTWSVSNTSRASLTAVGVSDTSISLTGLTGGVVTLTYSVSSKGDTNRVTKKIYIYPAPATATISGASSVCVDANTTLTPSLPDGVWTVSNPSIATITGNVVTGVAAGSATFTYTLGSAFCPGLPPTTATKTLTINPLADTGFISGRRLICSNDTATLVVTGTGSFTGGVWSTNIPVRASINPATGFVTASALTPAAIVTFSYTTNNVCGNAVDTFQIAVGGSAPSSTPRVAGPTAVYAGGSITLTATPPTGVWSTSNNLTTLSLTTGSPNTLNADTLVGVDSVFYTISGTCGSKTDTFPVTVVSSRPPVIISVAPVQVNHFATTVNIQGSRFNAIPTGNYVFFGTTLGRVLSGTTTSLQVEVPFGTNHDYVMVMDSASKLYATYSNERTVPYYDTIPMISATRNNFQTPVTIQLPGSTDSNGISPYSVEFADVDMDGRPDMIVTGLGRYRSAGSPSDSVYVYRNLSTAGAVNRASFSTSPIAVAASSGSTDKINVKLADLDGDKMPELIWADRGAQRVTIVKNNSTPGTISFGSSVLIGNVGVAPYELVMNDFDNDGRLDIGVTCIGDPLSGRLASVAVIRNNYNPLTGVAMLSTDFSAVTLDSFAFNLSYSIVSGDFNNDGNVDLAVSEHYANKIRFYQNASTAANISFATAVEMPIVAGGASGVGNANQIRVGDIDGDGLTDLVVAVDSDLVSGGASQFSRIQIYRNITATRGTITATGSFAAPFNINTRDGAGTATIALGDFNGDRKLDIVAGNAQDGNITIALNSSVLGSVDFTNVGVRVVDSSATATALRGYGVAGIAVTDIDTNTVNDIAVVSRTRNIVSVFRGFPIPDTISITSAVDSICAASTNVDLLRSGHIAGARGYWTSTSASRATRVAVVTANASNDSFATVYGASTGRDTVLYHVVYLYDTNTVRFVINVVARPDSGNITGRQRVCLNDTTLLSETVSTGVWSSVTPATASVDASGIVRGNAVGNTEILYTVTGRFCASTDTFAIRIDSLPSAGFIRGANVFCVGSSGNDTVGGSSAAGTWHSLHGRVTLTPAGFNVRLVGASAGSDSLYFVTSSLHCGTDTAWYAISVLNISSVVTIDSATYHNHICRGNTYTYTTTAVGGTWSSSRPAVATIDPSTGLARTLTLGTTLIQYTLVAPCGTFTDTFTLYVDTLDAGTITGRDTVCTGTPATYSNAIGTGTWSLGVTSNATLTASGPTSTVYNADTAVGTDTLYYSVSGGCGNFSTYKVITILRSPAHAPVTGASHEICAAGTLSLSTTTTGGSWSSSNTAVATINTTGLVTSLTRGVAILSYTIAAGSCGTISDTFIVNVDSLPSGGIIIGDSVCVGSTLTMRDSAGTTGGTWFTLDPTVATITPAGVLTGLVAGSANIYYKVVTNCGTDSTIHTVTVNDVPVAAVITGNDTLCPGASDVLTASIGGGTWTTADASIISVSSASATTGTVVGVAARTTVSSTVISYTIASTHGCASAVTLDTMYVKQITDSGSITASALTVCNGNSISLTNPRGGNWGSSNTAVATVDASGNVYGVGGTSTGTSVTITDTIASLVGCADVVLSRVITVYGAPGAPSFTGSRVAHFACQGKPTIVTATLGAGASSGSWEPTSFSGNFYVRPSASGLTDTIYGLVPGVDTIYFNEVSAFGCAGVRTPYYLIIDSLPDAGNIVSNLPDDSTICYDFGTTANVSFGASGISGTAGGASVWIATTSGFSVTSYTADSAFTRITRPAFHVISHIVASAHCGNDTSSKTISANLNAVAGPGDSSLRAVCSNDTLQVSLDVAGYFPTYPATWYSTDTAVARVVSTGFSSAVITAGINATNIADTVYVYGIDSTYCSTDTAWFRVIVNPSIPYPGIIIGAGIACLNGGPVSLSDSVTGGVWSSGNNTIATVNNSGVVTGLTPGSTKIFYTVSNICGSAAAELAFRVSNAPKLNRPTPAPICDSTLLSVNLTADTASASFAWSRASVFGIANASDTGSGNIREYLDDTTGNQIIVKYVVTSQVSGCSSVDSFNATIKPTPYLTSSAFDTVCSGSPFVYVPTTSTSAAITTAAWTRPNVASITPVGPVSGTGNVRETLDNALNIPVAVVYTYSLTATGCSNSATVQVTVNPKPGAPKITTHSPSDLCSKTYYQNFGAAINPTGTGINYYWTADNAEVWATGTTKQYSIVSFKQSGTATVYLNAVLAGYACPARDSFIVNVSANVSDSPYAFFWKGDFYCESANQDSYQWGYDDLSTLDSTIIGGQTNQNYTIGTSRTGNYYWVMTTHNGCSQKTYVDNRIPNAVEEVTGRVGSITLYPNPATQYVTVEINNASLSGKYKVEVLDMMGRQLSMQEVNDHKAVLDINDYASGVYFVECYLNGAKVATAKFVKN